MPTTHTPFDMGAIQASWMVFDSMARLQPIHDEQGYDRMVVLMNALLDAVGEHEDHPLSSLLELVGDLVSRYEQAYYPIQATDPKDSLRFLMEARGFIQADLSAIVPQSNLSAILAGKRKISAALAGKLGKFFGVSPALFVAG